MRDQEAGNTHVHGLVLIVLVGLLSSCVVLPVPTLEHGLLSGRGEIETAELAELEVGRTSREQMLLMLGEPELSLEDGRFMVYEWSVVRAYVLWAVGLYYSAGGDISPVGRQYIFLVEFDGRGLLRRYERRSVHFFDSFAGAVDAFTPDDTAKLVSLSRLEMDPATGPADLKRWVLQVPTDTISVEAALRPEEQVAVRLPVLPERDAGPHPVGFKTPGNQYAMAMVLTGESPDRLLYDSFVHGWRQSGPHVVEEGGIGLSWQVRKFSVSSPVNLTRWSAQGTIELDVTFTIPRGGQEYRSYRTTKKVGTLFGPGAEEFSEVLVKCLADITRQLGDDLIVLQ